MSEAPSMIDVARRNAAEAALDEVQPGMKLGLGSGRTAEHFVRALGAKVRAGLRVIGVATSDQTAKLAADEGIALSTLDAESPLDLTVDGADEIDPSLRLIKGGGGALLREKIVATASRRLIIIADSTKVVDHLGAFPLPVEIVRFGHNSTRNRVEAAVSSLGLSATLTFRVRDGVPFVTDSGNLILDASFGLIPDPERLAASLKEIPGVVEHGLFIRLAAGAIIGDGGAVRRLYP